VTVTADIAPRLDLIVPVEPARQYGEINKIRLVFVALELEDEEASLPDVLHVLAQQPGYRSDQVAVIVILTKDHLRTLPRVTREQRELPPASIAEGKRTGEHVGHASRCSHLRDQRDHLVLIRITPLD
jgi:hypothetical protein